MTELGESVTIREARAEGVTAIVALYADDMLGQTRERADEPLPAAYWDTFEQIHSDPRHKLVVVDSDREIAATLQLSFIPHLVRQGAERAQIEVVWVSASRRGVGLGLELLEWAIDQAQRRGCGMVQLTGDSARPDAHRLYEVLGFKATHEGMKLTLNQET